MSARDELAELLASEIPSYIYACNRVWEAWSYGTMSQDDFTPANEESDLIAEIADAVLAASYRKPRTITTVDELDALPIGSVVLHNGRAFQHYPAYPAPFDEYQKWKCGDGGFVRSTKSGDMILPALVIHEATA